MGEWEEELPNWEEGDWPCEPPEGDDPVWMMGDGELIFLSDIEDNHLLNIERFLIGDGTNYPVFRAQLHEWWYDTIRNEIERRGLLLKSDHYLAHLH